MSMQDFKTERFNHYPAFGWSRGFCFSWNVRGCKIVVNRVLLSTCKADNCKKFSLVWFAVEVNYIQLISVLQMMSFLQQKVTASVVSAALPIVLCTAFCFRNKKRQTRHCLTVTVSCLVSICLRLSIAWTCKRWKVLYLKWALFETWFGCVKIYKSHSNIAQY